MTDKPLDAILLDNTDASIARPLPPAIGTARADVLAAARDLLSIPEAALPRPWAWIGGSEDEVRYGAYRAAEALEFGGDRRPNPGVGRPDHGASGRPDHRPGDRRSLGPARAAPAARGRAA